jgi:ABC-2 type transport system ATP-binding protein
LATAVVRDVAIRVEEGRITGFLGPNGAGKTTTLRLLCGLLTPDSGEGEVLGWIFAARPMRSSARPAI